MVKKILIKDDNFKIDEEIVACIGFFDGLHLGHQELVNKAIAEANKLGLKSALICFNPDPVEIISKKKNNHIFSNRERENLIRSFGIDVFIVISFDEKMMKMDPIDFINDYLNRMNIKELVSGFDFSFGYMGKGNNKLLKKYRNFKSIVIPEHKHYGKKVSSTRIKEELTKGNLKLVNKLLGFNYYLNLKIEKCSKNEDKWLIEAINNDSNIIKIKDGQYDCFKVVGNRYYFISDKKYKKGDVIKYYVY